MSLRKKWVSPLIFFQLYLSFTIVLFFWGPWPWESKNSFFLLGYLLLSQLFIATGYLLSWKNVPKAYLLDEKRRELSVKQAVNFLTIALIVNYILLIPMSLSRTGNIIPNIFAGLSNPGIVYNDNYERTLEGNPLVFVEYIRIIASPLILGVFPILVVFWGTLSRSLKYHCVFIVFFQLALYVATGTNKGLADFIIVVPWLIYLSTSIGFSKIRFSTKHYLIAFIILMGFLSFFGIGQAQRSGVVGTQGVFNTGTDLIYAEKTHPVSMILPDEGQLLFESITRYLCQGYYALSLSFDLDHNLTFGFGHSMFLARNADSVFDTSIFTLGSIPGLLEAETGWGMYSLWHSIYPWFASDVGFFGALVVMGMLGYLFGFSWGCALIRPTPNLIILIYLILIIFYYIPANNQVFQSGESSFAFMFCLLFFVFPHYKVSPTKG